MALTESQRVAVRHYVGWQARFHQYDSRLEMALDAIGDLPESAAVITNAIDGTPPGLLAQLQQIDVELVAARGRIKADKVGSITLNKGELSQLRAEGRRVVGQLCTLLGVDRRSDVFGSGGGAASCYVGK